MISMSRIQIALSYESSANVAFILGTAPPPDEIRSSAFGKSLPTFSTASCAGSATNDEGNGGGGGQESSIQAR